MTKFLFFFFFIGIANTSLCQSGYPYQDIKLEKPSDYKGTEPLALNAATFLISTPFSEKDISRAQAIKFLTTWVMGAKEYQFYLKGKVEEILEERNLLGLYIAAMVKFSLENKTISTNPMIVEINASKLVITYCDEPKNNFKLKKKYRKVLEKN